ncbi:MAG TPA: redox-sensing transcriptional repressor Rex [Candidatus Hydrogenedentes bacterium]|jgi:redox-sensing transcriptional repressor|nr:redox-sensing transcriptional repressor Rex [Candidatus Hydrogenedentota bacterium]HPJ97863.1 redox-sensing transcriptional repressor Rex [Candidatus Hydrogenedentota bacterium]
MGRSKAKYELGHAHLERLVHYYHFLGERVDLDETTRVSSQQLAQLLTMDDTQVRKDLAAIGVRGVPRLGYRAADVVDAIRQALGFDTIHRAILVGAGRLGGALAAYRGFVKYGLRIVGVFDQDPGKVGTTIGTHFVYNTTELETVIERNNVRLAILAVPAEACQALADRLVRAGIAGIWNFGPTTLTVPSGVVVRHEHIVVGLAELAYHLQHEPECHGAVPHETE